MYGLKPNMIRCRVAIVGRRGCWINLDKIFLLLIAVYNIIAHVYPNWPRYSHSGKMYIQCKNIVSYEFHDTWLCWMLIILYCLVTGLGMVFD